MKILLGGNEITCHDFHSLDVGTVFQFVGTGQVGIKNQSGGVFNVCSSRNENYNGTPVVPYPDARLVLDHSVDPN